MGPNDKVLRSVMPNAGIGAEYRRRLLRLVRDMQRSIVYWLGAAYKANQPAIAQDKDPVSEDQPSDYLQRALNELTQQWQPKFDEAAQKLAEWFARKTRNYSDKTLTNILKDAGIAVEFTMTDTMRDAYQAVIHEQVGLIRSIAAQHLQEVQGLVMRSVQNGRDLGELTSELSARYGITKRRAALIARDQNNKANSVMSRVRHQELGITTAKWRHSHAGKHPRPSHVKADGEVYDVDKGMYLDGKWTWPGVEINCRCTAQPIIKGFD